MDVSVISTMQQRAINRTANSRGYALQLGEERKMKAHAVPCYSKSIFFVLLIVETIGGWSEEAASIIGHVGHLLGQRLGSPSQRLAIALWRGNATLWIHRRTALATVVNGLT